jgi:hypothetical protein
MQGSATMAIPNRATIHSVEELSSETTEQDGVWPALVNVYQEQGYEAGYARGVNDVMAAFLEATEEFVCLRTDSVEARRLLHAFSEFLENHVQRTPPDRDQGFTDGLGI